jgi:two-component system, NtrC family, sensor kinase
MQKLTLNQKIEKILPLLSLMNRTNDINDLLNNILAESERIFSVEGTSILLEDIESGRLFFYFATGEKEKLLSSIQMERGEGVCGYVFQTGNSLIENDPANSKFFSNKVDKESDFETRNLICVPLMIEDKIIGVFELINKIEGDFDEEDADLLVLVGSQISLALERARLVEEKLKVNRLAAIGETIAGLSHCIKNILSGLQGGEYMVNKYIKHIQDPKINKGWEIVKSSIGRISSLVLDMLYYSKEREPEYRTFDVTEIINELIDLEKNKAYELNVDLHFEPPADLSKIEADPKGLYRSLMNLITNSLDAFYDQDQGNIWIILNELPDILEISIRDDGCGMDEAVKNSLFTKFFSTKGSSGSGLGLAVTKKIIEELHGQISVESTSGVGTEFKISLPKRQLV